MLNKYNRGLAVAMLSLALGIPAYAQSANNASLTGMRPTDLTVSINEISAEAAVNLICEHFGYTPMFHMPLTNTVSIDLANASFDEAMERVLGDTASDYMLEGNRLHVFKPRESWSRFSDRDGNNNGGPTAPKAEPIITKIIPLGKRTAADIQKLVKELNPKINAVHDVPTNSVIIMGPESLVNSAELLCKNIDEMEVKQTATDTSKLVKGLRYVTQTYELEHADFEEIEKELETIIDRETDSNNTSSGANLRDKDGNPIETEYFLLDKARRIIVVHTTMEKIAVIDSYFKAIDRPLPQVAIEATILAVDDGLDRQLGMKWNGLDGNGATGYFAPAGAMPIAQSISEQFKHGGTLSFANVQALLKAVETDSKSEVLSKPRVITVTGKTSSIHVGDEIPYTSGSTITDGGNSTSSVAFKEVGIKLDVTPTVNLKDNTIQLNVVPEVSQWVKDVVLGNNVVPQVSTRKAESTIKINNGETMVMGGLIETSAKNTVTEIPILSQIPLVGKAFRNKNRNNSKTNLIILLTAHVVDPSHRNEVTSKAVHEMNEIKPLRYSQAVEEIAQPTVDGPDVYGENVEWPREIDNGQNSDGKPVSEPARTNLEREEAAKKSAEYRARINKVYKSEPVKEVEEAKEVEASKNVEAIPADNTNQQAEEETTEGIAKPQQKNATEVENYLQKKLDEIRTNLNTSNN